MADRKCIVCGIQLHPFKYRHRHGKKVPITSHEFECYKKEPNKVPKRLREEFERQLAWEQRHNARVLAKEKARIK